MEWSEGERSVIEAAQGLRPLVRERREAIERERRLPDDLVDGMAQAGIFSTYLPAELGGLQIRPRAALEVIEAIAREDGSAGWNAAICGSQGLYLSRLAPGPARTVLASGGRGIAGSFGPEGKAVAEGGGYRLNGRWRFASGMHQSAWLMAPAVLIGDDGPLRDEAGNVRTRVMLLPKEQATLLDTWDVGGMRGTGSHDFTLEDVFVPEEFTFGPMDAGLYGGALYRVPILMAFGAGIPGACLGIARGAIDELVRLAAEKRPTLSRSALRERPSVQLQVAEAETMVRAARLFLEQALDSTWRQAEDGLAASIEDRAVRRLAMWNAGRSSAVAVRLMYEAAGTTAIYATSPLERAFRDIHVAAQHVTIGPMAQEAAGRALLGLDPGSPFV